MDTASPLLWTGVHPSAIARPAASGSGKRLTSQHRPAESEDVGVGPACCWFNKSSRWFPCKWRFENHCLRGTPKIKRQRKLSCLFPFCYPMGLWFYVNVQSSQMSPEEWRSKALFLLEPRCPGGHIPRLPWWQRQQQWESPRGRRLMENKSHRFNVISLGELYTTNAGKDWRREEKGMTEDEMVR